VAQGTYQWSDQVSLSTMGSMSSALKVVPCQTNVPTLSIARSSGSSPDLGVIGIDEASVFGVINGQVPDESW
jgi:hypothetical protein